MDHADLVAEFPQIEKMTPAERIQLARQRRALQLIRHREREEMANGHNATQKSNIIVVDRKPRAVFKSSIILLEATSRNDIEEVRKLLASNVDPNAHNEDGLTPLHQCAIDNNEKLMTVFLEFGANVNAHDTELWTPLHAAACCGHLNIVKLLIEHGAKLLAVNAEGNMPYDICDDEYTLDYVESEMAKRGITQEDIDHERSTPERQMLADMQTLREKGGNLEYRDKYGATPLHTACANGFYTCAQFLLDCGVSTHVRDDDGWQPIHAAACWAQPDSLELLVAYGSDINSRTTAGETPLDLCEDESVRSVIMSLQVEAQRRRLLSFARDSRRMSKRRKPTSKFESPNASGPPDGHLVATRGAIRRLSIRDRAGVTLARLEARREAALMRSWSFEDSSAKPADGQDDAGDGKKGEIDSSVAGIRNGTAVVQLVGVKSSGLGENNPRVIVDPSITKVDETKSNSLQQSADQQSKLHKAQNDERKPTRSSKKRRNEKAVTSSTEPTEVSSSAKGGGTPSLPNGLSDPVGAGATVTATSEETQVAFSRHPLTLSALKKQRSEDRKTASESATSKTATTAASSDGTNGRTRYRSPSDVIVGSQSPKQRTRRRKINLRCCSIC